MTLFTIKESKLLKKVLAVADTRETPLSLEELHGFLFGLAIIPEPILPSEWLHVVFGNDVTQTLGLQESQQLVGTLFDIYHRLVEQNHDDELCFPFDGADGGGKNVRCMRAWTKGFFFATNMRPELWGMDEDADLEDDPERDDLDPHLHEDDGPAVLDDEFDPDGVDDDLFFDDFDDDAAISASFAVVMGVAFPDKIPYLFDNSENDPDALDKNDPELEAKLFAALADSVETLRFYAAVGDEGNLLDLEEEVGVPQMPVRVEKIGRNDPCPCGSGAKFKKCCGK